MVEHQYITSDFPRTEDFTRSVSLSEIVRPCAAPSTPLFQNLVPYPTESFNSFSSGSDANALLTPISATNSPTQQQFGKFVDSNPRSPDRVVPRSRELTDQMPLTNSRMYQQWTNHFEVESPSSQTTSSVPTQGTMAPDFVEPYLSDGRRTPNPPEPYYGSYAVSEGQEQPPMHPPGGGYYLSMSQVEQPNPLLMRNSASMAMDIDKLAMPTLAPALEHHHHPQFRQSSQARMEENGSMNRRTDLPRGDPPGPGQRRGGRGGKRSSKRKQKKETGSGARRKSQVTDPDDESDGEHKNCFGHEVPPELKLSCPDEERFIFECRWKYRQQKGQDMWESIQRDFTQRFQRTPGKETLQMKFKRGRAKYIQWLERDEQLLKQAWVQMEQERYQTLLDRFIGLGGSRNMLLNSTDIEVKVVNDLRLEDSLYLEDFDELAIRRRRKSLARARAPSRSAGRESSESALIKVIGANQFRALDEDTVIEQVQTRVPQPEDALTEVQMWNKSERA